MAAAAAGAAVAAVSMSSDGESAALGIPVGAAAGLLACFVTAGVVTAAGRRGDGGVGAIGFMVAVAAAALAGLSILLPPVSLAVLAALVWLGLSRRRRAQRKYEGLRILR